MTHSLYAQTLKKSPYTLFLPLYTDSTVSRVENFQLYRTKIDAFLKKLVLTLDKSFTHWYNI